jgi:predicted house-cleaning noncanonical NTP pyrophosphatase (MazG superfamily)
MQNYNKLVRDKIPEIIKADGKNPKIRILTEAEYNKELLKKLVEEALEAKEAGDEKEELIKEIGDVEEVIEAVIKSFGLDEGEIKKMRIKRKKTRGSFDKRIFLESAE